MEIISKNKGKLLAAAGGLALLSGLTYLYYKKSEKTSETRIRFYTEEETEEIKKCYCQPFTENSVIVVGATPELLHIYLNMLRQGFWLFLIGLPKDTQPVMDLIKETIREVEGMEYPENESTTVADQEINRIHYFSMVTQDFETPQSLLILKDVITQMLNPAVIFVNHAHPYEKYLTEETAGTIVTNFCGERLMEDLEIQKNIELPGNRADDEYVQPSLSKMKSMRMTLNTKSAVVHLLDRAAIDKQNEMHLAQEINETT